MKLNLSKELLSLVSDYFKILAEPVRLQILWKIGNCEMCVGEIVDGIDTKQPNVSKHLKVMQEAGILNKRQLKNLALYTVSDPNIFLLCDIVCGALNEQTKNRTKIMKMLNIDKNISFQKFRQI
ncbi:MAG TPA: metalloregulator ArsR/SmtB family transcription factor [Pyrinomonadaceae bacterium]|nr:metalloregulator ArsR/SmtB family transcription factor [Pyrinomonadaceae bacterium]